MRGISYWYRFILCAENITPSNIHDVSCAPLAVWFSNGDTLNVEIEFKNFPSDNLFHHKVFLHDGVKKIGNIDSFSNEVAIQFKKILGDSWNEAKIRVCLSPSKKQDCDEYWDLIVLHNPAKLEHNDCITRRCILTIDWHKNCKEHTSNLPNRLDPVSTGAENALDYIPELSTRENSKSVEKKKTELFDKEYEHNKHFLNRRTSKAVDSMEESTISGNEMKNTRKNALNSPSLPPRRIEQEGKPIVTISRDDRYFVIISCSVRVMKYDLLSLFQKQGEETPQLLQMEQHLSSVRDEMVLIMNKTLQYSDKNQKVYCVKQSIDDPSVEVKSEEFPVLAPDHYHFLGFEPAKVTVEPSSVWFEPNSTLNFVCNGTQPVEGRKLNWYIRDMNSAEIEVPDSNSQQYDPQTNQNNLTLHLNESFHLKTLLCAEDFFCPILYRNGSSQIKRYGVRDTSEIVLKLREEKTVWGLVLGLVLGIAAILAAIFVLVRARRRRSAHVVNDPNEENGDNYCPRSYENYYVTPQVTYAVLDLPEAAAEATPAQNEVPTAKTPYVKIVGVYNPKK